MNLKALIFVSIFSSSSFLFADPKDQNSEKDNRIASQFYNIDMRISNLEEQINTNYEKISKLEERMESAEKYFKDKNKVTDFYNHETAIAAEKISNQPNPPKADLKNDPLASHIIKQQTAVKTAKTHKNFQEHKESPDWFYHRTKIYKYGMRHKPFPTRKERCCDRILPNVYVGDLKAVKYCLEKNLVDHIISFNSSGKLLVDPKYSVTILTMREQDNEKTKLKDVYRKCLPMLQTYKKGVLIHCSRGHSRSASLCILAIMKHYEIPYQYAQKFVKFKRPTICPNPSFVQQLIKIEKHS